MLYFLLFLLSSFIVSCSDPPHWVTREELKPVQDPNIQKLELVDGSVVEFNHSLGWYDIERAYIEGISVLGLHDTVPLALVQRAELTGFTNQTETALLILAVFLVVGTVAAVYLFGTIFS